MWLGLWGVVRALSSRLPLNALAENPCGPSFGVIIIYAIAVKQLYKWGLSASNRPLEGQHSIDILTSNQVGLPAELKHINKRRKRN